MTTRREEVTAIGFDFDDTLVFSEDAKERLFADVFEAEYGSNRGIVAAYRELRGKANRDEKIHRLITDLTGDEPTADEVAHVSKRFGEAYRSRLADCPVAGCIDVLVEVRKYVEFAFLVSLENEQEVTRVAEHCGMAHLFDVILGGPASKRENFAAIIREHGVVPSKTLYVGDSRQDVVIAGEHGFKAVGVQRDFTARNLMDELGAYVTYCDLCGFAHDFFGHYTEQETASR